MQIPAFDEFLSSFSEDELESILIPRNGIQLMAGKMNDIEDLCAVLEALYVRSAQDSVTTSLRLLRQYHQWLSSNLE